MKEIIHRFANSIQKFQYVKACVLSFVAFIITSVLMFVTSGVLSSFFCSVCAGILTGFVFFLISGLKAYDEYNLSEQKKYYSDLYEKSESVIDRISIVLKNKVLTKTEINNIRKELCYSYHFYLAVIETNRNSRISSRNNEFNEILLELFDMVNKENKVDNNGNIYSTYEQILTKTYKLLTLLMPKFYSEMFNNEFDIIQFKSNPF